MINVWDNGNFQVVFQSLLIFQNPADQERDKEYLSGPGSSHNFSANYDKRLSIL